MFLPPEINEDGKKTDFDGEISLLEYTRRK